jgi:hypothetical protein
MPLALAYFNHTIANDREQEREFVKCKWDAQENKDKED